MASRAPQSFNYRAPRVPTRFPVQFRTGEDTLTGWTLNVSDQGLMVQFLEPVQCGTKGRTRLTVGHCTLEINTHVVHTEGFCAGLHFDFAAEKERAFFQAVLEVIARTNVYSAGG